MKKLWNIFLVLAIIGIVAMRFTYAPQKSANNLFVDGVVAATLYAQECIVNENGEVVANIELDDVVYQGGFTSDGLACYGINWRYVNGWLPTFDTCFINTKGEVVIEPGLYDAYEFSGGLASAGKDGKFGYIDTNGNTVIDFQFRDARPFNDAKIAPVDLGGHYGYIDKKGNFVIEPRFDNARSVVNGMAVADFYIINEKTGEIIETDYNYIQDFGENGMASVKIGQFYGYVNSKGKIVIEPQFIEAGSFSEGFAPVKTQDEKWCYINEQGVIVMEFDGVMALGSFHNGLAWVANEKSEYGYINLDGEMVIEQKFRYHEPDDRDFKDDGYAVVTKSIGIYGVIDKQGNYILEPIYSSIN